MIMNKQESVFAVVNDTPKKTDYNGIKTETADVHVDNVNREISVDVDFSGMLGETSTTAYPGYLGATALKTADVALRNLNAEIDRSTSEDSRISNKITSEVTRIEASVVSLIAEEQKKRDAGDIAVSTNINKTLQDNYATKQYVAEQITSYSKVSKQVVDGINFETNKVIVNGIEQDPVEGVIYLVRSETTTQEEVYKQYTLVGEELTLIGDTGVDLTDYAKITYVDQSIGNLSRNIDSLSKTVNDNYSELTEVIDSKILEESTKVDAKLSIVNEDIINIKNTYATKTYVDTEILHASRLTKLIVEDVDIDNDKIKIDGEWQTPTENVIYLVKVDLEGSGYTQYTLIDGQLVIVGGTDIDLTNYVTTTELEQYVTQSLNNIKFIDGGNSASILI